MVYEFHDDQIAEHGGAAGLRDAGLHESALASPLNAFAYAAGIVKNHPFMDGNRRTGFIMSELFLNATDDDVTASVRLLAAAEWNDQNYAASLREYSSPIGV